MTELVDGDADALRAALADEASKLQALEEKARKLQVKIARSRKRHSTLAEAYRATFRGEQGRMAI